MRAVKIALAIVQIAFGLGLFVATTLPLWSPIH
jgi:hypothetical protein